MENLIFLLFILVSAAATWMQKRRQQDQDSSRDERESPLDRRGRHPQRPSLPSPSAGTSPQAGERPKRKRISWEEELRRLLEGEAPTPAPPPERPRPAPAPPERTVISREQQSAPQPRPAPLTPPPMPSATGKMTAPARRRGMSLKEARREAERLRSQADKYLGIAPHTRHRRAFPGANAIAMLKHSESARQAFIASVIISPPKAFEEAFSGSAQGDNPG